MKCFPYLIKRSKAWKSRGGVLVVVRYKQEISTAMQSTHKLHKARKCPQRSGRKMETIAMTNGQGAAAVAKTLHCSAVPSVAVLGVGGMIEERDLAIFLVKTGGECPRKLQPSWNSWRLR